MLPSRGRGRGRGRGRRNQEQECVPGKPQDPAEEKVTENVPCSSQGDPGEREHPQFQESLTLEEKSEASVPSIHQKEQLRKTQDKAEYKKCDVLPEELGIQFKRKLALTPAFPERPDVGNSGKRIKLVSNCFPITVPSGDVYHYDVTIIRKRKNVEADQSNTALLPAGAGHDDKKYRCLNTKRNREIITLMLDTNPLFNNLYAAYDGQKNLYTRRMLRADFPVKCEIVLPYENADPENLVGPRQDVFEVQIKPVIKKDSISCSISLDSLHAFFARRTSIVPQETVMALETILRHGPCLRFTPIGRSFFSSPDPRNLHPLSGGLEVWFGYHQSVRLGQWGPMVNIDVTATTFSQKGPVLSYVADFMNITVGELRRRPYLPNTEIKRISNKLKNMRIEVTHLRNYRRKYRIVKMVKESANRLEFDLTENGRTVKKTVAAYFRERYERILEFPNLPCLQVYPENKNVYLPVEVCEIIEGQHYKKKLEPKQKAEMIRFTALPPNKRFSKIRQIANDAEFNNDTHVREFELEVSPESLPLEGRVIDPPSVQYKNGETIKPQDGSWNMRRSQFLRGAVINSWVLLSFSDLPSDVLNGFSGNLAKMGRELGISINSPKRIDVINISKIDLKNLLLSIKNQDKAELVVIVLPMNDKFAYGRIKQTAETVIGLKTQCIKEINVKNPKKCSPQLLNNICQKINAKMGGENNSLVPSETPLVMRKPVIIIGADVNHPGPSRGNPSLAACVGSLDMRLSRFAVSIRAQVNVDEKKQSVEVIRDLKDMIVELLRAFYRHTNGKKPEKIIFYRDGVSEGQFEKVRDHEVRCIREACRSLAADYQPGITFIVVQKRHHIRFMPKDPRDGVGNSQNIPPGTTVDTVVTDPANFDFYLCSHYGLKGTSRPSHYTVVEDDNNFNADDLQKLTYQLCHTYARCTRSISIPVPVAYADLAAYRARQHLEAGMEESTSGSDSSAGAEYQPLSQSVIDSIKVIEGLKNAMYFV